MTNSFTKNQLLSIVSRMEEAEASLRKGSYVPLKLMDGATGNIQITVEGKAVFFPDISSDY